MQKYFLISIKVKIIDLELKQPTIQLYKFLDCLGYPDGNLLSYLLANY